MAIRRSEDNFVKVLRSYSEAITGGNAKPHDFIPSDPEDIERNALDTESRSDDDDRDQAIHRAEQFMDRLYDACAETVMNMFLKFTEEDPMNGSGLDVVLEHRNAGEYADEGGFDGMGLAMFADAIIRAGDYSAKGGSI